MREDTRAIKAERDRLRAAIKDALDLFEVMLEWPEAAANEIYERLWTTLYTSENTSDQ
jgi:hypothetical protein